MICLLLLTLVISTTDFVTLSRSQSIVESQVSQDGDAVVTNFNSENSHKNVKQAPVQRSLRGI